MWNVRYKFLIKLFLLLSFLFSNILFSAESTNNEASFLVLTDLHFNPLASCQQKSTCPLLAELLEKDAGEWDKVLSNVDSKLPTYKQNTNYALLRAALSGAAKEGQQQHVKFILILGDFLSHNFHKQFQKYAPDKTTYLTFVKKTFQFINTQIKIAFPDKNIYMVAGNNDSYVNDYRIEANGVFFNDLAELWSSLIKEDAETMQSNFKRAGYYALDIPEATNLRLLVLNTVLFSYKAKGSELTRAANEELAWFSKELSDAKKQNKKVLIVMHIPIGIDIYITTYSRLVRLKELWKRPYIAAFENSVRENAEQIIGIIAGHLHSDWFEIFKYPGVKTQIPVTGVPSISPIYGNSPGFKIYRYSENKPALINFMTYYFSLDHRHTWSMQYDFNRTYQPNCYHCPIINGMASATR